MTLSFVKSSFWILIIANTANVAQYSSQLILGRYLQVADYGIFNAVNSLSLVVVTFVAVIPFIVSKYMIRFQHDLDFRNKLLQKIFCLNYAYLSIYRCAYVSVLTCLKLSCFTVLVVLTSIALYINGY